MPNLFGGHKVYADHVEPADLEAYLEHIRQRARQYFEQDLRGAFYVE